MFGFLSFLLTSLLFFLFCFLEPWWPWSIQGFRGQLGLTTEREKMIKIRRERKENKKKRPETIPYLPVTATITVLFFCLHGLMDLWPWHYLNWRSWIWFLETPQSLESVGQLQQIIVQKEEGGKKKKTPKISKTQTSGRCWCWSCVDLSDWNKWTKKKKKMPPWTKMQGQRGVRMSKKMINSWCLDNLTHPGVTAY